jgi:hypothetical protein
MSVVSFGPSELAVSSEGDLLCAVDSRWPVVVVAGLATLSARVLAELPVDTVVVGRSGGVGWSGRDVLVAPAAGGSLIRVNSAGALTVVSAPASPRVLVRHGTRILGIAHGSGVLTVLEDGADEVTEVPVGVSLTGLAATGRWIWVTDDADGSVSVLDADTFEPARRFEFPGARAGVVCAAGDRAFVHVDGPGHRLTCLDADGRRVWTQELVRPSGPSVTDGVTVWTAGRLDERSADSSAEPVTSIDLRDAVSGAERGTFAAAGQVRGLVLTARGLLIHGFRRGRQADVVDLVDAGTGAVVGELDTDAVDVSRFWPPEPTPLPVLPAEEFRQQFLAAVIAEMTTPGTAYDARTDRPTRPTNPVTRGFTHMRSLLDGGDVVVTFRWHDDETLYGIRADIDGLTHSWGGPAPGGAAGVLTVMLMEFLDTGGVRRAVRIPRAGYVELTGEAPAAGHGDGSVQAPKPSAGSIAGVTEGGGSGSKR